MDVGSPAAHVVSALIGGIVGLLLTVYFEDRLVFWREKRKRAKLSKYLRTLTRPTSPQDGLRLPGHPTKVHLVEGDGTSILESNNIKIDYTTTRQPLPEQVQRLRNETWDEIHSQKRSEGATDTAWNAETLISLSGYDVSRTATREDVSISVSTSYCDYATFAATNLKLDIPLSPSSGDTLRARYILPDVKNAVENPIPFLANGVGVSILLFTRDGRVILTRRGSKSRARPGEADVSVVEGVHASHDVPKPHEIDIYQTAVRGFHEELGIYVPRESIQLLAFGVDMHYYQWNFMGLAETAYSAEEVKTRQQLYAKDRWEGKVKHVGADAKEVLLSAYQDDMWDMGMVTIYMALCKRFGIEVTELAAKAAFS